ncbi:MAG: hypothetical protein IPI07_11100 [Flavobacteriales bacterium]|nr:hypothetical protein [Flavobacteriales bacterium]
MLRSELRVLGIKRIEMHLLQLPGWFLLVGTAPRPSSQGLPGLRLEHPKLTRIPDVDKTAYLWHRVRPAIHVRSSRLSILFMLATTVGVALPGDSLGVCDKGLVDALAESTFKRYVALLDRDQPGWGLTMMSALLVHELITLALADQGATACSCGRMFASG